MYIGVCKSRSLYLNWVPEELCMLCLCVCLVGSEVACYRDRWAAVDQKRCVGCEDR